MGWINKPFAPELLIIEKLKMMKIEKDDKSSFAGTDADSSTTVEDMHISQPIFQTQCYAPLIFLDIDGVFNCQIFYHSKQFSDYKEAKKSLRKSLKKKEIERLEYYQSQICRERIAWFNKLCEELNAKVIISSTWRMGKTVEQLQEILNHCGGIFEIIGKTDHTGYERGTEIAKWLRDNIKHEIHGCHYYDFHKYAIIDDDSDMLLNQRFNFFQTDNYSGLTPNICYKIKRFITGKTFGVSV
jgi:hypothetical protein